MKGYFRWKAKDYGDIISEIHTGLVRYTLQQLRIATDNFSSSNKIVQDEFGDVFRGLTADRRIVAVKRYEASYRTIYNMAFSEEINALSRIHHRNIISLIGFCISKDERLLVFDYAENRSLGYHLHESENREELDWRTRRKIALGTARALAYLHHDCEPRIIHRNIHPDNILLNSEFEAKVSSYLLAKPYPDSATHLSTMVVGRIGFLDPHYAISGKLTSMADVYSFGIMMLVMITGVNYHLQDLLEVRPKAVKALKENMLQDIVDPCLLRDYDPEEITCMVACAIGSTLYSATDRPTMKQIIHFLEGQQALSDSFISQVLEIEENSPFPYSDFLGSPSSKSFTYPSSDEDIEDMKSLPLSPDMNPPASSSSYINPLPSLSEGDLVAIDEDMKSLPLSSDMNLPTLSSDINPLPLSSDMNSVLVSSEKDIAIGLVKYTLQQLETATNNFSTHNVIGKGGFATVYKGNLENGLVAIKKLIAEDERRDEDFKIEINAITRVSHVNIISLVGYCIDGSARLLVYELAPNGSLADHLRPERRSNLDWETRKKIMLGTARALEYLHDNCMTRMVHRDIKPANVLLSSKFEAKLADLGIAKLQSTSSASHLSTNVKGTPGYVDPYYFFSSTLTHKSDVYSFGILLLVSVTGFTPSQELEEAKEKLERTLRNRTYDDLADKCLNNVYDPDGMQRMIACAAVSTLPSPNDRPTMEEIVEVMRGVISPNGFIRKYLGKKNHK